MESGVEPKHPLISLNLSTLFWMTKNNFQDLSKLGRFHKIRSLPLNNYKIIR